MMLAIPNYKKKSKVEGIRELIPPKQVYLPLTAYKGNLTPVVEKGDQVLKYQLIAKSEGQFSTAIHSPISGTVNDIIMLEGKEYLTIENDFIENQLTLTPLTVDELLALPTSTLIQKIKDAGIEGGGGAQFPTHVKYTVEDQKITTLIINGAECEPFLTADFMVMKHYTTQLVQAIRIIQHLLGAKEVVIAIEKHNKELKALLIKAFTLNQLKANVKLLPNTYPQGGELQLIKGLTGKELPKGSIPSKHGVIVSNVGTVHAIYNALFKGIPAIERIVTFFETNQNKGENYKLKVGTPIIHVLNTVAIEANNLDMLILGGPMMGKAIKETSTPITKGSGGLLYLKKPKSKENNCIACGYCSDVCPQRLIPLEFARNFNENNTAQLAAYNLMDCIECGACSYVCPSDVPLMWSIKKGKETLKKLVNHE